MEKKIQKVILIIRDGWGVSKEREGNAVYQANTPIYDVLRNECPHNILQASGEYVGLPKNFMGNSEVGHLNIGAGRVVNEMITRINNSIEDNSFFSNPSLMKAINNVKKNNSVLHIVGVLQDTGVHSMNTHLYALLKMVHENGLTNSTKEGEEKVKIHIIADGKDVPKRSVSKFFDELMQIMNGYGMNEKNIATIIGKDYGMDRNLQWEKTKLAYECMVLGEGRKAENVEHTIKTAYENHEEDNEISPTVIGNYSGIKDKDSIIFFNYRLDCIRELTKAFVDPKFDKFERKKLDILFVCFSEYFHQLENYNNTLIAFHPEMMQNLLGEVIAKNNLLQLRVAEKEKEAHVTYFFNGEFERPFPGEHRIILPSPNIKHELKPETSSYEVAEKVISEMHKYDFVVVNFASTDLCGHTGDMDSAIKSVEVVDECVGKVLKKAKELGFVAVITSDHGNCESMIDENGEPKPSHSTNPVDLIIYNYDNNYNENKHSNNKVNHIKLKPGKLADVAPTILNIMGIEKPKEMTGNSLIV